MRSKDSAAVRALASNQRSLGLSRSVDTVCGLSLMLDLSLVCSERVYLSVSSVFNSPKKTDIFKHQFDLELSVVKVRDTQRTIGYLSVFKIVQCHPLRLAGFIDVCRQATSPEHLLYTLFFEE